MNKHLVARWVALQTTFESCAGNTRYEGGGCRREAWWRKRASDKQLWAILEEILREASIQMKREGIVAQ